MAIAVSSLSVGDPVIVSNDGSARMIRSISKVGNLFRIAFDDGRVRLEPETARYELAEYTTRPEPRTHTIAIELRGITRRAYVYATPGLMYFRDWYTAHAPAADFADLAAAQEWLVRVIGYEALDREIHQNV